MLARLGQTCRAAVATVFGLGCLVPPAAADREDQWLFRQTHGPGRNGPTAVFLSSDYGAVIFRATCDRATRELVLEFFGNDQAPPRPSDPPLSISSLENTAMLSTRLAGTVMIGRVKAGPELLRALSDPGYLEIDAPTDMGEPLYVGHAEPLRRLAWLCQE